MKTVKLDSYKEFTPQNLADELQREIDAGKVEDVVIIYRENEEDIRYLTTPISDSVTIGILEMVKMNIFNN
ncbi:hypothetical protein ETI06_05825 [Macrococcoides goetzii]|nr:hypothetical protein [Macrococcus goetzii]TDM49991.1 hypothetical protein ETI06_05825 [Macrococcus goetzii]